jgi:hypothetical protein
MYMNNEVRPWDILGVLFLIFGSLALIILLSGCQSQQSTKPVTDSERFFPDKRIILDGEEFLHVKVEIDGSCREDDEKWVC